MKSDHLLLEGKNITAVFEFFYHFLWTIVILPLIPLLPFIGNRRTCERLGLRLTLAPFRRGAIWIHALSVGEVISALPLVRLLKRRCPQQEIVFTVTTTQAMDIARRELEKDVSAIYAMPLDFWWSMLRMIKRIRPSLFVLVETDLWPGILYLLKKRKIKTILVNGRISPRTFRSYRRFSFFSRFLFNPLGCCLMQSELDRKRLLQLGIDSHKVNTVGNIKFDREWIPMTEGEHREWLNLLHLDSGQRIWVAGSTHRGEDFIILDVFLRLQELFPELRLIIAPREIDSSGDIYRSSLSRGLQAVRKTGLSQDKKAYSVLILDTIGELGRIYGIAEISFVGGSLVPLGGHNLLEPASFGCPVIFGPHTNNFVLMSQMLIEAGGGIRVIDGEDLFQTIKRLLSDPESSIKMGRQASHFVAKNRGALGRIMDEIEGSF